MRAVVQRVLSASVSVEGETIAEIKNGLLVLLGVHATDTHVDAAQLAQKIVELRVFEDSNEKMNLNLKQTGGEILAVSQFTLFGDCRKGRRPSFVDAAKPEVANTLYEAFVAEVRGQDITVQTGKFQQDMQVALVNDGPVTLLLDTQKLF